jgi:hypothetical protein
MQSPATPNKLRRPSNDESTPRNLPRIDSSMSDQIPPLSLKINDVIEEPAQENFDYILGEDRELAISIVKSYTKNQTEFMETIVRSMSRRKK